MGDVGHAKASIERGPEPAGVAGAVTVVLDARGMIASVTRSVEALLGWPVEDLVGRHARALLPDADGALTGGDGVHTGVAACRDGSRRTVHVHAERALVGGSSGTVCRLEAAAPGHAGTDEVELIRTLALAVGSAPTLDDAMKAALETVCMAFGWDHAQAWVADEHMALVDASWARPGIDASPLCSDPSCCRVLRGQGLVGFVWDSGRPLVWPDLSEVDPARFPDAARIARAGFVSALCVPVRAAGRVVALFCFHARDKGCAEQEAVRVAVSALSLVAPIVRQKTSAESVRKSEERLALAARAAGFGTYDIDLLGGDVFWSTELHALAGIAEDQPAPRTPAEAMSRIHEDDRAGVRRGVARALEPGGDGEASLEFRIIRPDGRSRWVQVKGRTLFLGHGAARHAVRASGIVLDISERKKVERQAERHARDLDRLVRERTADLERTHEQLRLADRMASIGTLAAGLGHDMNNVLLPVRAHLNTLEDRGARPDESAAREHLAAVRKSVAYLQQLADGLHYLAMDPDGADDGGGQCDLREWWAQSGVIIAKAVPKHVEVRALIDEGLPAVPVPAHALTQAVLNLVVNAGEAIDPAPATGRRGLVQIRGRREADSLVLEVEDNGRGMTPEVKRRALDMFFTTKTRGLGTGLGLPLARRVADRAGGRLEIDSTPGAGTVCRLVFPLPETANGAGGARGGRRVALTIADPRAAALVHQFVEASGRGFPEEVEGIPSSCDGWIVEQDTISGEDAMCWRSCHPGTPLVVLTRGPEKSSWWVECCPLAVVSKDDFEGIRSAVSGVLTA